MIRCIEVMLAIPDNEARTALATLERLGVPLGALERADLYRCDVAAAQDAPLVETLRGLETIFNPNKHVLRVRDEAQPGPGEVWIGERAAEVVAPLPIRIAGRTLHGVRRLERLCAWRMYARSGVAAPPELVTLATETLLCNSAFQKAIR